MPTDQLEHLASLAKAMDGMSDAASDFAQVGKALTEATEKLAKLGGPIPMTDKKLKFPSLTKKQIKEITAHLSPLSGQEEVIGVHTLTYPKGYSDKQDKKNPPKKVDVTMHDPVQAAPITMDDLDSEAPYPAGQLSAEQVTFVRSGKVYSRDTDPADMQKGGFLYRFAGPNPIAIILRCPCGCTRYRYIPLRPHTTAGRGWELGGPSLDYPTLAGPIHFAVDHHTYKLLKGRWFKVCD